MPPATTERSKNKKQSGAGLTPEPISSNALTAQADMKLPPTATPTAAAGLAGALETQTDQFTKGLEETAKQRETGATESLGSYLDTLLNSEGQTALTDRAYKDTGVDQSEADLKDINNQILQEQQALRRATERVQTSAGTATLGEREREVGEIERVSLRKQADLAVVQLARQGKYDSAKAIADRAVAMQFEKQKQQLDARKFVYEENKDFFTKAEQRSFETQLADRNRKLEMEADKEMARFNQVLQQNDPLYKAQVANIYSQIADRNFQRQQAQADLASGVLNEAQIKAIDNSPQGKKVTSLGTLKQKLSEYETLVDQYGTSSFGSQKSKLDASFADLKIAYKTAAELGALQGPDIVLLEEALRPASYSNPLKQVFSKLTGNGLGAIKANLEQAQNVIGTSAATNVTQLYARNPAYRNSEYVASLIDPLTTAVVSGDMYDTAKVGQILKNPDGTYVQKQKDGTFKLL